MKIDTEVLNELAARIESLKSAPALQTPELIYRQNEINSILNGMITFCRSLASLADETENSMFRDVEIIHGGEQGFSAFYKVSGKPENFLRGSTIKASGEAKYSLYGTEAVLENENSYITGTFNSLSLGIAGSAAIRMMKKDSFDPMIKLQANIGGNLANASVGGGVGNNMLGASVEAVGEVGAVYANAEAILSTDEIGLEAQVGAAAARGECSLSFNLMDVKLTLTGEGSVGSAEAGFEYHHSAREWEVGSKLGFIAGLGVKIKVEY
ncbi:hypothetical protein [Ileibacterium valens]|uniref:Uncharacterized protein n=1 Tax=Ileibacterium valens TaxID=1862668 RepID=A0A1U7NFQ3_9FIRM|nr:hypothetical protein [Ileibacterium valens]OLU39278.1 hypothetical protein BO222_06875 [Ileibacterium valens]OLU39419.1 hypothetical protein BO224_07380 [Erysipelotrichaceae bacterium NYU-BL-E8]OLU42541.1 hypothetical protein BM735_02040 [Erysipelotrichaceae bacterium NYU-BL-F16]